MGAARKFDLDQRLEAYFATLRSSTPREAAKHGAGNWQIYAAVTGSALAMVTGASASIIGSETREVAAEPVASVRALTQHLASSRNMPLTKAVRSAMARRDSGKRFVNADSAAIGHASQSPAPSISAGGVVPLSGPGSTIQPGEWVSIYGKNLAAGTAVWNGDFPVSLGGTSVQINGKAAYLSFVSPGQINLQAPDDTATGTVNVVVTNSHGSFTSTVTLAPSSPSFMQWPGTHDAAGVIVTPAGTGFYGGGVYDLVGPSGSFSFNARPVKPGEVLELFGVGFGPTNPPVPAGQVYAGQGAPTVYPVTVTIGGVSANVAFAGITEAGLYQFNVTVPDVSSGDQPLQATVNGVQTGPGPVVTIQ